MDIVVEEVTELNRKLTITIPGDKVGKLLDKAYNKIKKDAQIKGFRRGKVPRSVLERKFKEQVEAEVGEQLVQKSYFDAVEQEKLEPVVHPEITEHNFGEDGSFVYVAVTAVKPVFEVKGYKGLEAEKPSTDVSEADVDERIEELRRNQAVLKSVEDEHPVEKDDIVIVDFQGFHNGKPMKEVHNTDYSVDVGRNRLGEEFEKKLLGLTKGEKTLFEIDFPADYPNPILAGKLVEFKIDVKDIKVRIKPELDDEFAKDVNPDHTGMEDLRVEISAALQQEKEKALQGDMDDQLMEKLLELNEFEVPERLVMFEVQEMLKQTEENLKKAGLSLESAGIKLDELAKKNKPVAEKRVRGDFILKKIAEVEEIKVSDEDIEQGYQRIGDEYNMGLNEVKNYFQRREEVMPFIQELLNEKIISFLRKHADFVEKPVETKEEAEGV